MTEIADIQSQFPDPRQDTFSKVTTGFWVYLMTDCLLFATLFATYGVLHKSTFGGPSPHDLFDISTALAETIVLLLSSFTCGLGMLAGCRGKKNQLIAWFCVAFLFGLSFVVMELTEFTHFVREGHTWQSSAFLSSFFTLVGTHGTHVSIGLLWMVVLLAQLLIKGITTTTFRRLVCFTMFWHFLDLVWVFIFTFVYLMGVIG